MFKITEYNRDKKPLKDYDEYTADTFEELPVDAPFGSRAFYSDGSTIKIAMKFTSGWIKG